MALFKQQLNYAIAPLTAMSAPFASVSGSNIALNAVVSGSTTSTAGLVIGVGLNTALIEYDSLRAKIQTKITTNSLTVVPVWQVSDDGTNWSTIVPHNGAAYVQWPPTGNGTLATTTQDQAFQFNPSSKYIRIAVVSGGATGGAGDNVIVAYNWRQRFTVVGG